MNSIIGNKDTICAISSAVGAGAVALVRISGPKSEEIIRKIAPFLPAELESHRIYYGILREVASKEALDEVLISYFEHGRSFTGESSFEISTHGGVAIPKLIVQKLIEVGARHAERGEFTYRAFMNGRIDLVQAESILSLVSSETDLTAKAALRQLQGHLSKEIESIQDDLSWSLSRLEANLDFSSEFIEFEAVDAIVKRAESANIKIKNLLNTYKLGRVLSKGFRVAIVGAPNVGKSSLLNQLVQQNRAIVTPVAGTTRDTIEVEILLAGQKVTFVDTAGLRETTDEIELFGIERTQSQIRQADFVIFLYDRTNEMTKNWEGLLDGTGRQPNLLVGNKSDLVTDQKIPPDNEVFISAQSFETISPLVRQIENVIQSLSTDSNSVVLHSRQYESLRKMEYFTTLGLNLLKDNLSPEFIIAELQQAYRYSLGLLGKEFDDQILDRVFKEFCLGK
jgi:tRNA modification GTPase